MGESRRQRRFRPEIRSWPGGNGITVTRRALTAAAGLAVIAAAAVAYEFRPGDTRSTDVPRTLAAIAQSTAFPSEPRAVIVVVEENKSFDAIVGNTREAPYINALAARGALFTASYGVAHPSQPNYFALFAGRLNEDGDTCPASGIPADAPNLASRLMSGGKSFRAYSEGLPHAGFMGCSNGEYARKHAPWTYFTNVPATSHVPFSTLASYDTLPSLSFIIPDMLDDMHSASIARGDTWLRTHLDPIVRWAQTHNALVVLTFDESSDPVSNHIATLLVGPMVKPGRYAQTITPYSVHDTIERLFGIAHGTGDPANVIAGCWIRVQ